MAALEMAQRVAPAGDVTLMFTDIEGSTSKWETFREAFRPLLERHNALIRACLRDYDGYEVKTIGDSFMAAFGSPHEAAACALDIQRVIEAEPFELTNGLRVRIGLHTGELEPLDGDYFGPPVNRAARIESAAHGGMILLSDETAERLEYDLPNGAVLLDLGERRLRDLGGPRRIFRLHHPDLPQRDYPKIRTLSDLNNVPAQVDSFVGRERELKELSARLGDATVRLITLTGPGGTGKTRLSLQTAAENDFRFPDGIWFVELANVTNAREVPSALALALGITMSGEGDARTQIFAHLKEKRSLLVMDNFEQVIDAARFVSDLLRACPQVKILVSSRQLLSVRGEHEYALDPLGLPPPGMDAVSALRYASVQLFVERAQASKATFELTEDNVVPVCDICHRLEGLPLAVELTASLIRGLTPQQLLPRLQDRFKLLASTRRDLDPRQRSLRGAIDWGYELLTVEEQEFFARLSVFSGGFFLSDAEAVCGADDAFLLVQELRDKSLLRATEALIEMNDSALLKTTEALGETRYAMLETIRDYAREKLDESGELEHYLDCHSKHFLAQSEEWSAKLASSGEAVQRMKINLDNLRTGMDWAEQQNQCETVTDYGRALFRFFYNQGLYEEGEARLQTAENACRSGSDPKALARLLNQRGLLAFQRSDLAEARRLHTESYEISKELGDTERMVPALANLGNAAWAETDYDEAEKNYQEALALVRTTRESRFEAQLLDNLGILASDQGRFETAQQCFDEALTIHRRDNNQLHVGVTLMHLAESLYWQGQLTRALEHLNESHELFKQLDSKKDIALVAFQIGVMLFEERLPDQAFPYVVEGLRVAHEIGDPWCEMYGLAAQGRMAAAQGNLNAALYCYQRSYHLTRRNHNRKHIVSLLEHLAQTLNDAGWKEEALRAFCLAQYERQALKLYDHAQVTAQIERLAAEVQTAQSIRDETSTLDVNTLFVVPSHRGR